MPMIRNEGYTAYSTALPFVKSRPSNTAQPLPYPTSLSNTYQSHYIKKRTLGSVDVICEVYEPSREPTGSARSKIEHHRSRERNCVRGPTATSVRIKRDRFGSYACRKQTWCECEHTDTRILCKNAFNTIDLPEKRGWAGYQGRWIRPGDPRQI